MKKIKKLAAIALFLVLSSAIVTAGVFLFYANISGTITVGPALTIDGSNAEELQLTAAITGYPGDSNETTYTLHANANVVLYLTNETTQGITTYAYLDGSPFASPIHMFTGQTKTLHIFYDIDTNASSGTYYTNWTINYIP
jgi:hypothetical protein